MVYTASFCQHAGPGDTQGDHVHIIAVLTVLAVQAAAPSDETFEKLKSEAESTEGLSAFLTKYIGECEDDATGTCKKASDDYRKKFTGKKLYLSAGETAQLLKVGARGEGEGEFTLLLTPFFASSGYAITSGAPSKTDPNGNPITSLMRLEAVAPDGDVDRLGRMISMGQLVVETVFVPQGTWQLRTKTGVARGVKAKLLSVRVLMARDRQTVAVWNAR
jgi:hypothetical protein